jgi:hypothetical protein
MKASLAFFSKFRTYSSGAGGITVEGRGVEGMGGCGGADTATQRQYRPSQWRCKLAPPLLARDRLQQGTRLHFDPPRRNLANKVTSKVQ